MRRYILTGTPGAGKTSILHALAERGYSVIGEAATDAITREQTRGRSAPWAQESFVDQVVALQRRRQLRAQASDREVQFYDRSPVCTHALSIFLGRPVSARLAVELDRITRERVYERQVLFVRNVGFCEQTAVRRISFEESLEFERVHEESYRAFGYQLIDVPAGALPDRVTTVLGAVTRLLRAGGD